MIKRVTLNLLNTIHRIIKHTYQVSQRQMKGRTFRQRVQEKLFRSGKSTPDACPVARSSSSLSRSSAAAAICAALAAAAAPLDAACKGHAKPLKSVCLIHGALIPDPK